MQGVLTFAFHNASGLDIPEIVRDLARHTGVRAQIHSDLAEDSLYVKLAGDTEVCASIVDAVSEYFALTEERELAIEEKQAEELSLKQQILEEARKVDRNPTDAQIEAGNYRKGHVWLHGMQLTIENPRGSIRSGTGKNGKPWRIKMPHHYGYIRKTKDVDGDHVDVFLGPEPKSELVFIIDQIDPETEKFDEHKVMLGFITADEAKQGYLDSHTAGWKGLGSLTALTIPQFKEWLEYGSQLRPISSQTFEVKAAKEKKDENKPKVLILQHETRIRIMAPKREEQPRDSEGKFTKVPTAKEWMDRVMKDMGLELDSLGAGGLFGKPFCFVEEQPRDSEGKFTKVPTAKEWMDRVMKDMRLELGSLGVGGLSGKPFCFMEEQPRDSEGKFTKVPTAKEWMDRVMKDMGLELGSLGAGGLFGKPFCFVDEEFEDHEVGCTGPMSQFQQLMDKLLAED